MGFTSTITYQGIKGKERYARGTFTSDGGSTGGDIDTGITLVKHMNITATGSSVTADATSIDETLPCNGRAVTIKSTSNAVGIWEAYGV